MSRDERFSARDKKTHKMTKDGLVERNESTGEEQRISQRGQDFQMRQGQPEQQNFSGREAPADRSHRQPRQGESLPPPAPDMRFPQQEPPGQGQLDGAVGPNDAPIRPGEYTAPTTETASPRPSLVESARGQHSRASGDAPRGNQRGTAYQSRFTENAAKQDGQPQDHPTTVSPTNGLDSPDSASDPTKRSGIPHAEPAPRRASAPEEPRAPVDNPRPDGEGRFIDSGRSSLRFGEDAAQAGERNAPKGAQHGSRYARKFAEGAAKPDADASDKPPASTPADPAGGDAPAGGADAKPGNPKFQFAADELPPEALGKKLTQARRKAERIDGKLDKARKKLPTRRRPVVKKTVDADTGKAKHRLQVEKEVKTQRQHLKGPLATRPVKAAANTATRYGHKKMFEVEEENVGAKAAHRSEMAAEGAVRSAYRFSKTRPYRKVAKLQQKSMRANVKLAYQKALSDNPKLRSNLFARFIQKQKIKRQYAKAARDAKRAGQQAATLTGKIVRALGGFVRRHPVLVASVALLLLMLFFIMTAFSSCSNMAGGGMSAIFMSSYTAPDADIDDAELAYREWETDLEFQVNNAESKYPGYDEYKYSVDDIGHNPYELMAYLTAKYHDFTFADVEADLRAIFAEQYKLTFTPEVEIRTRMVTKYRSVYDPDTGDYLGEEEYEEEEQYEWHILHINLTALSFTDVVAGRLDSGQREHYDLLMDTKGNRAYTLSPFAFDWHPYISCFYGWRVHPITGARDNHRAVDIAVAAGTEILAAHDGKITTATWHNSYGNYIALDDGKGLVTKYAHCSQLLVSAGQEVKKGDVIAKVGSTGDSTGPHLHFEVIKDGVYLNPLFFAETIDDGTGGRPPGSPGGPNFPDYPGAPMTDERFASMMEEAQKHLGKPYVFGTSGPNKFDCSGFVSYVLAHSTHPGFKRTNAQGIYNQCTPVSRDNAKPGDLIFFEGTYSTSNKVTHIGIYIGNGQMIHAGKPVQYASIDTKYWKKHFYAFGRLS